MQCCKTEIRLVSCRDLPGLRALVVDKIPEVKVYILVARWLGGSMARWLGGSVARQSGLSSRRTAPTIVPRKLSLYSVVKLKAESIFNLIAVLTP